MNAIVLAVGFLLALALGAAGTVLLTRMFAARRRSAAEGEARAILAAAEAEIAARRKELEIEQQERAARLQQQAQEETKRRRRELDEQRRELEQRARNLNRRHELLESKQADLEQRQSSVDQREAQAERAVREAEAARGQQQTRLEQIARMTAEQARQELVQQVRAEARREAAAFLRKVQEETREEADREAHKLVLEAVQRLTFPQVMDATTTVLELPNEEMKGRIIGREGRNIRSLEMATGIDLLVDDTPQAILLSCFDPVRREIARLAVERLVEDGRIHPARIEEVVEKTRQEFEEHLLAEGEAVAFELGISELHPRLTRLVGRMRYQHAGGHNLLQHTRESVLLATDLAAQLGADAEAVRRASLLHEAGVVDDSSSELHPTLRSADLAQKFGEPEGVVRALRAMHPEAEETTVEGILVLMGHQISDARPGARKENLEIFTRRMSDLEAIASSFAGVTGAFAVKAGKELRVLVNSTKINDPDAIWLARDIARRIQEETRYPGQIRVSVIRETRAVDYAM